MTPIMPKANSKNPWPARVVAPFTKADAGNGGRRPQGPISIDVLPASASMTDAQRVS